MAHEYFGETDVANVQMTLIANLVQEQLVESVRLAPTVLDYSALAVPGLEAVNIPRGSDLSAAAKSEDTAINVSHFTYAADSLTLGQRYVAVDVDDIARVQSNIPIMQDLISRMGVALADDLDTLIYTQLKNCSSASPDHLVDYTDGTNNDIEVADITNARKLLNIQKVPQMDRFMLIPPTQENYLLNIDSFVEADKYGSREALMNGEIGRLFGFKVIMSNVAESDNYCVFYHKSHACYAIQEGVKFERDRVLTSLSDLNVASYIVGAKVLDIGTTGGKRGVRVYAAA